MGVIRQLNSSVATRDPGGKCTIKVTNMMNFYDRLNVDRAQGVSVWIWIFSYLFFIEKCFFPTGSFSLVLMAEPDTPM